MAARDRKQTHTYIRPSSYALPPSCEHDELSNNSIIEKTRWGVAEGNHGTVALPDPAESPVFFPPSWIDIVH